VFKCKLGMQVQFNMIIMPTYFNIANYVSAVLAVIILYAIAQLLVINFISVHLDIKRHLNMCLYAVMKWINA